MRKSLYNSIIPAAMIALGSLGYNSANAQQAPDSTKKQSQTQTFRNLIYSTDSELNYSACGDGVLLKDFVHNLKLEPDTDIDIKKAFRSKKGQVTLTAVGTKRGYTDILSYLGKSEPMTDRIKACIDYFRGLSKSTEDSDPKSVSLLEKSLRDGKVDRGDSLFSGGQERIKDGRYIFVVRSPEVVENVGGIRTVYQANSIPFIVDVKTDSDGYAKPKVNVDSLEEAIRDRVSRQVRDSLEREKVARDKFVSDSIKEADAERARERGKVIVGTKPYGPRKEKLKTRYGFEVGAGTNLSGENELEGIVGGFVNIPLSKTISVGGYGDFYVLRGNPISSGSVTDTLFRGVELIGPGTYKHRVDRTTTKTEDDAKVELGAEFSFRSEKWVFPVRAGVVFSGREETIEGESDVWHERNKKLLGKRETIKGDPMEGESSNSTNFSFSFGADYKLTKNFSVGTSFNRTGEKNSGRLNLRYTF